MQKGTERASMRTLKLKNVIYFPVLNCIGGVETFCYEFGLKYGREYDITVIYRRGDAGMISKIGETCRMIQYREGDVIDCDVFIFGWGHDILDRVRAGRIIQTFHADYINRHLNPSMDKRITHRFGVSENTTRGIREHYEWAKDIETMYNPYTVKRPRKVLNLISATRLTPEKGLNRMIQFAAALDAAEIPFLWTVYTDSKASIPNKSVVTLPPRLDVLDYIARADYLVQLSDTEGYSYSIVEALSVGTPVIVTDIPVAGEQGVEHGRTGWILPMDMSMIPVTEIYRGVKRFKVAPRESHYETVLVKGEAEYTGKSDVIPAGAVKALARVRYRDMELERSVFPGEAIYITPERAEKLVGLGLVEIAR